jgi:hypothetical protein
MVWDRKTNQAIEAYQNATPEEHQALEQGDEKWDKIGDKRGDCKEQQAAESTDQQKAGEEELQVAVDEQIKAPDELQCEIIPAHPRPVCEIFGLSNHVTRHCRRFICEICGLNTHMTYDCKNYMRWNLGPKLCAAQVKGQSFFYIPELVDPRVAREKDSTTIISVISG